MEYASNLLAIRQSITILSAIFIVAVLCFMIIVVIQIRNIYKNSKIYKTQYNRILELLQKTKCMIIEYDISTGKITPNNIFKKTFGFDIKSNFFEQIHEKKNLHPEFNSAGLIKELHSVIKKKETRAFESVYCTDKVNYKILSIVMMPVLDSNGEVSKILGSVRETSDEHLQLKKMTDMFKQIPGGTYRCYLEQSVSLEYVGPKLCKMLGYAVEEFKNIIGEDYVNAIVEEDQENYKETLRKATMQECVQSCQYRMKCKDGTILSVLDTMESMRDDSGIMYSFSVVVDISAYEERQNITRQEIKQLEKNLEIMRIQNSTSQMQPHFLYNALSSIREVILQDPQYASDLVYDFTVYLRACIRTMQNSELITIEQEIDNIRAYVNIEKMRMGKCLKIDYDTKSENFMIAPLSIQPLVENAIRHGIYKRGKKGGTVSVQTETLTNSNRIIIKDDGVGFDYQKVRDEVEKGERNSTGLDNVIFRLTKRLNAEVIIKSSIGEGTVIVISIPRKKRGEGTR